MRAISVCATVLMALPFVTASAQSSADDDAAKTLEQMEQHWADAAAKQDIGPVQQMLSDDFTLTISVGRVVDKESYVNKLKDGTFKIESLQYADMKTRVYGNCAVVVGRVALKGTWDTNDVSGDYAFTDTFVKKSGKWRQVASQVTRIEG